MDKHLSNAVKRLLVKKGFIPAKMGRALLHKGANEFLNSGFELKGTSEFDTIYVYYYDLEKGFGSSADTLSEIETVLKDNNFEVSDSEQGFLIVYGQTNEEA